MEFASWLGQGALWIDGWSTLEPSETLTVSLRINEIEKEVMAHKFNYPRPDLAHVPGAAGQVLILPMGWATGPSHYVNAFYIHQQGEWYRWTLRKGVPVHGDLTGHLIEKLEAFEDEVRESFGVFVTEQCAPALALDAVTDPLYQRALRMVELTKALHAEPEEEPEEEIEEDNEADDLEAAPEAEGEDAENQELEEAEEEAEEEEEEEEDFSKELPPPYSADPAEPLGLCIDRVIVVDSENLFLKGWFWDAEGVVEGMDLVDMEGERIELLDSIARVERDDLTEMYRSNFGERLENKHGFLGLVEVGESFLEQLRYLIELRVSRGESLKAGVPGVITEPFLARDEILRTLSGMRSRRSRDLVTLLKEGVHQALLRLQERCRAKTAVARRTLEIGEMPASPRFSLIAPIFQRVDLVEHQLAQLADDPGIVACELIYVLDSPDLEQTFEETLFHLSLLYQVPIRAVFNSRNAGYAAATNLGATHATDEYLILMHSDVFADRPGWFDAMAGFYESREEIGVLGPKLLYEDQSLQHTGVYFSRDQEPDELWSTFHLFKGLPRHSPAATQARRVPTRTRTSVCGAPRRGCRAGICRRPSSSTSKGSRGRRPAAAGIAIPGRSSTTGGCRTAAGTSGSRS